MCILYFCKFHCAIRLLMVLFSKFIFASVIDKRIDLYSTLQIMSLLQQTTVDEEGKVWVKLYTFKSVALEFLMIRFARLLKLLFAFFWCRTVIYMKWLTDFLFPYLTIFGRSTSFRQRQWNYSRCSDHLSICCLALCPMGWNQSSN